MRSESTQIKDKDIEEIAQQAHLGEDVSEHFTGHFQVKQQINVNYFVKAVVVHILAPDPTPKNRTTISLIAGANACKSGKNMVAVPAVMMIILVISRLSFVKAKNLSSHLLTSSYKRFSDSSILFYSRSNFSLT